MRKFKLIVISVLVFAVHAVHAQFLFQAPVSYSLTDQPTHICTGDFNNDGKYDIATSNKSQNSIAVLLGNGTGQFSFYALYPVGMFPQNVSTADFNHDQNLDLVCANPQSDNFSLLLGNGNGTFAAAVNVAAGVQPMGVALGNFNINGNIDIVLSLAGENSIILFSGNGNASFQNGVKYSCGGVSPNTMEKGDFNNDGKMDIVVGNAGSQSFSILLNNGNGGFAAPIVITAFGGNPIFVSAASDINSDGFIDVIQSSLMGSPVIYRNNGAGGMVFTGGLATGNDYPRWHCVADFDQDGSSDIAGVGTDLSKNVVISAGDTGAAAFFNYQTFSVGGAGITNLEHIIAEDLDGDGAKDILVTDPDGSRIVVFINDIPTQISNYILERSFQVYPNPANTIVNIKSVSKEKRTLYNSVGQVLFSTDKNEMNVSRYSKGIYYIKVENTVRKIVIE